jgi:hypothetical protein
MRKIAGTEKAEMMRIKRFSGGKLLNALLVGALRLLCKINKVGKAIA